MVINGKSTLWDGIAGWIRLDYGISAIVFYADVMIYLDKRIPTLSHGQYFISVSP